MKFVALFAGLALAGSVFAQVQPVRPAAPVQQVTEATKAATATPPPAADSCEAKAIDKNGKPLAGAAKTSFMKKCAGDSKGADASAACEAKAMDKNGKPLAGAAKSSFVKKCVADAKG